MKPTYETALVTDSTADIPDDQIDMYDIHVVPNILVIEGKSMQDGINFSRREFYDRLPVMRVPPTTATASSGTYENIYEQLLSSGFKHVISIHASSTLSGIFNAARLAAENFSGRVHVVDSGQLSLGMGFQILTAAESLAAGAHLEKILQIVQGVKEQARVVAMLDTLEYVRRSGRVSWARARIGSFLQIKPFVEVKHGKVLSIGDARTRRKGIERLRELLAGYMPFERLAILHSNADADAEQFLADLGANRPAWVPIVSITPIIGVHVGPNGLGFALVKK